MTESSKATNGDALSVYTDWQMRYIECPAAVKAVCDSYKQQLNVEQCLMGQFLTLLKGAQTLELNEITNDVILMREIINQFILDPESFELKQEQII
jgi:hypothetical protein